MLKERLQCCSVNPREWHRVVEVVEEGAIKKEEEEEGAEEGEEEEEGVVGEAVTENQVVGEAEEEKRKGEVGGVADIRAGDSHVFRLPDLLFLFQKYVSFVM